MRKLKCSKKVWDKLTPAQRKKFDKFNQKFFDELKLLAALYPISRIGIIAHNLALTAIGFIK